jgi:hypothetical protein
MSDDDVLFEACDVKLESTGAVGTLRVGSRTVQFGESSWSYPSILLHAIAVSESGAKYLYLQLDAGSGGDDDSGMVDAATTADVLARLQNGAAAEHDDAGSDADEADVTEMRFVGLSDEQVRACYEAMSRAAELNPDPEVDANSFFGGLLNGDSNGDGGGVDAAAMMAAWESKLDVPDEFADDDADGGGEADADEPNEQFEDADEAGAGERRTIEHEDTGLQKKSRK